MAHESGCHQTRLLLWRRSVRARSNTFNALHAQIAFKNARNLEPARARGGESEKVLVIFEERGTREPARIPLA